MASPRTVPLGSLGAGDSVVREGVRVMKTMTDKQHLNLKRKAIILRRHTLWFWESSPTGLKREALELLREATRIRRRVAWLRYFSPFLFNDLLKKYYLSSIVQLLNRQSMLSAFFGGEDDQS